MLSIVPFGGYVKMLGQDDIDPSQSDQRRNRRGPSQLFGQVRPPADGNHLGRGDHEPDHRPACSTPVPSGWVSTLSTADRRPLVQVGLPAWEAGMEPGDRIWRINGESIASFDDIMLECRTLAPSQRLLFQESARTSSTLLEEWPGRRGTAGPHSPAGRSGCPTMPSSWPTLRANWSIKERHRQTCSSLTRSGSGLADFRQHAKDRRHPRGRDIHGVNDLERAAPWQGHRTQDRPARPNTTRCSATGNRAGRLAGLQGQKPALPGQGPAHADRRQLRSRAWPRCARYQARHADRELVYQIQREGEPGLIDVTVPASRFLTLGMSMEIGQHRRDP